MSRPYLHINSVSYATPVLTLNYTFFRLRGDNPSARTLTVAGLSSSFTFVETHVDSDYAVGSNSESLTFSVATLGTSSTTVYTAPALAITYGGTVSATTNIKYQLQGLQLSSFTASLGVNGPTLSNFLTALANSFVFSGANTGFSAAATSNSIVFSAPNGNLYNGFTVSGAIVIGASSFTYSNGNTFSGGVNTYPMIVSYTNLGGNSDTYNFNN